MATKQYFASFGIYKKGAKRGGVPEIIGYERTVVRKTWPFVVNVPGFADIEFIVHRAINKQGAVDTIVPRWTVTDALTGCRVAESEIGGTRYQAMEIAQAKLLNLGIAAFTEARNRWIEQWDPTLTAPEQEKPS